MKDYKLYKGSVQWQFQQSRAKIQFFGGGFGNGKTTSAVVKALMLARDYPGSNGLIARSTYPKLNDTIRKEFFNWCPPSWIERAPINENIVQLTNGSVINFRYVAQQGKNKESTSSNLLSATYDWIVVDQIEDPEISHKDFLDLLGRLRGNTAYRGDDHTMPISGPRWFIITSNPTRNWVYRKLIKPLHDFQRSGRRSPELLVDEQGNPIIELFEGSTYTNKENLPPDFIKTMEAAYTGQMRERFLLGQWGAYEGLVYPQYDAVVHQLPLSAMIEHYRQLVMLGYTPEIIQSYDHGIAVPACYLFAFVDQYGNVFVANGFYEKEQPIDNLARLMKRASADFLLHVDAAMPVGPVLADPSVFKRGTAVGGRSVGQTVAGLFQDNGIMMRRADNSIAAGINKVQQYLTIDPAHPHPITNQLGSPRIFFNEDLHWLDGEISDYYWKKDTSGDAEDKPRDGNDHAMDALKYLLSKRPRVATLTAKVRELPPGVFMWSEVSAPYNDTRKIRHGHKPY